VVEGDRAVEIGERDREAAGDLMERGLREVPVVILNLVEDREEGRVLSLQAIDDRGGPLILQVRQRHRRVPYRGEPIPEGPAPDGSLRRTGGRQDSVRLGTAS